MTFSRWQVMQADIASTAASNNASTYFYFPRAFRITKYAAVPSAAEALHATQESKVEFIYKGLDGATTTVLCTLTNSSAATAGITLVKAAWVAHDALQLDAEARTATATAAQNVTDAIPAGGVVQVKNTKAAGTTTSALSVFIEGFWSS